MEIRLTEEAQEDLKESLKYYHDISSGLKDKFLKYIDETFENIKKFPELYPFETKYSQKILVKKFPFVVFYTIYEHQIVILAIFHTSRNPKILEERLS